VTSGDVWMVAAPGALVLALAGLVGLAWRRSGRPLSVREPHTSAAPAIGPRRAAEDPAASASGSLVRHGERASRAVPPSTLVRGPVGDVAARLEPASKMIGASAIVVWRLAGGGRSLDVLAAYGYSAPYLSRLAPLSMQERVMAVAACLKGRPLKRPRKGSRLAAMAVPMRREGDGTVVGVVTAEFDPATGDRISDEAEAIVTLLAAQVTPLVAALAEGASPSSGPAGPSALDEFPAAADAGASSQSAGAGRAAPSPLDEFPAAASSESGTGTGASGGAASPAR
jgi:hypothetical protein